MLNLLKQLPRGQSRGQRSKLPELSERNWSQIKNPLMKKSESSRHLLEFTRATKQNERVAKRKSKKEK